MTSRERVQLALNFQEPDRVPLDLGGTLMSGIHGESYARLKRALGISGGSVRLFDLFQMICEVEPSVVDALGVDVLPVHPLRVAFGLAADAWKPYRFWWTPDWTETEVPAAFAPVQETDGSLTLEDRDLSSAGYPARMPDQGWYFDRLKPTRLSDRLELEDVATCKAQLRRFTEDELDYARRTATRLYRETDKFLVGGFYQGGLSGPSSMSFADWMIAHLAEPAYVHDIFSARVEVTLENLRAYRDAVGITIGAIVVSGVDYGTQKAELFRPELFAELYLPHMRTINDWIHANTEWKTLYHSDGSMRQIIGGMIEAGMDILNPVQLNAAGMGGAELKKAFGDRLVFWGAGVNPQETLPFGTPEQVRAEVREHVRTLAAGGGFVFAGVHNLMAQFPTENLLAVYEAFAEARGYPVHA